MIAQDDAPAAAAETPAATATAPKGSRLAPYLPGRREAMFLVGGGFVGAVLSGGVAMARSGSPEATSRDDEEEVSERDGREMLEAGNARYVAGTPLHPDLSIDRRDAVAEGQAPFAAILSCADSRVPPELLFDQGLGDLFVVRSAGQVIDHAVLGSLQYGVQHLKTPLLVVLGHSECDSVKATVEAVAKKSKPSGTDMDALVAAIRPAVIEAEETTEAGKAKVEETEKAEKTEKAGKASKADKAEAEAEAEKATEDDEAEQAELVSVSVDINVERIVERLKASAVIREASTLRKVKVVGAVYSLETGQVNWL
jgi:carbonic anhydrase